MTESRTHELYERIGVGYATRRVGDPRIAVQIRRALGDATSVVNVGAGAGSYEPPDMQVIAVEPSMTMIRQRRSDAGSAVQAVASRLPLIDRCADAAMALLTIHHWPDQRAGLAELRRVSRRRVVLLTWDPDAGDFWLTRDYFPQIMTLDRTIFPSYDELRQVLGTIAIEPVPIPHDCSDGFLGAYWRRPEQYLKEEVRRGISAFARIDSVDEGIQQLRRDLEAGRWQARHGSLHAADSADLGYRLVTAGH